MSRAGLTAAQLLVLLTLRREGAMPARDAVAIRDLIARDLIEPTEFGEVRITPTGRTFLAATDADSKERE